MADNPEGRWISTETMPLLDNEGRIVGTFNVSRDITSRKIADSRIRSLLEEKEMILKEVHHRIKNNLNTVMAYLSLQQEKLKEPSTIQIFEDTQSRIMIIMMLYDKLYRSSDFQSIAVKEYLPALIDEILKNFSSSTSIKREIEVGDFELSAKFLQPLGIIINELLTNIMKYAFTGRTDGTIRASG